LNSLSAISLVLGTISVVGSFAYLIYKIARRIEQAVGVDGEGRTLSERVGRIEYQLWENGGESLKDQVNAMEVLARQTSIEVSFIKDIILSATTLEAEPLKAVKTRKKRTA
jgi:hypothetical protein